MHIFTSSVFAAALALTATIGHASPQQDAAARIAELSNTFPALRTPFGAEEGFREILLIESCTMTMVSLIRVFEGVPLHAVIVETDLRDTAIITQTNGDLYRMDTMVVPAGTLMGAIDFALSPDAISTLRQDVPLDVTPAQIVALPIDDPQPETQWQLNHQRLPTSEDMATLVAAIQDYQSTYCSQ